MKTLSTLATPGIARLTNRKFFEKNAILYDETFNEGERNRIIDFKCVLTAEKRILRFERTSDFADSDNFHGFFKPCGHVIRGTWYPISGSVNL